LAANVIPILADGFMEGIWGKVAGGTKVAFHNCVSRKLSQKRK